ncbi:MAG: hypothetical protein ABI741_15480 [Ferruginibacter sp.]
MEDKKLSIRSKSQPLKKRFIIGNIEGGHFKCLINFKDGILNIDPYSILDKRTNPKYDVTDPHFDDKGNIIDGDTVVLINANQKNDLYIDLNRAKIGNPTQKIVLHYRTLLLGLNNISIKFRPTVKDYNDSIYSPNVLSSSFNLGLSIGYSFGWTKFTHRFNNNFSITPSFSLGFSAISLSKEPLKKNVTTKYNPSNFVLSPAFTTIIARNDVGITFSYGHDIMFGKNASAWAYQGKRWFGIGVAAGLKL